MWCVFIILGIVAGVLKANAILAIPIIVEYILFGIGGLLLVIKFIIYCSMKRQMKNMTKNFNDRFNNRFNGMF